MVYSILTHLLPFYPRHPDKNPTDEAKEKYKDITVAYETLSDPTKRNEYELTLQGRQWPGSRRTSTPTNTVELNAAYVPLPVAAERRIKAILC